MTSFRFTPRKNKYKATKTADGFPSLLERAVWLKLEARRERGEIHTLERQQQVVLIPGKRGEKISIRIDFKFVNSSTGETYYAEAKGFETRDWLLKLKLWRSLGPGPLELWKGTWRYPKLAEVVVPKAMQKVEAP